MHQLLHSFDMRFTRIIAGWSDALRPFFHVVTSLGDPVITVSIGIGIVLYGFFQSNMRLALSGAMVWITLAFGALLKILISRERPLSEYAANLRVDTFSFPSGHASGSMIAYGLLAYIALRLLPQPWGYLVAGILAALIIAIGVSRVYLGAHFPSDVLAGWILGGLALCIIIFVIKPLT